MTRMIVNGEPLEYKLDPDTPLLWALRDASNLTGTKYGCDSRDCGACTVIIDGRSALSCAVAIRDLEGARVTTIEGLSGDGTHPVQQGLTQVAAGGNSCLEIVRASVELIEARGWRSGPGPSAPSTAGGPPPPPANC